MSANLPIASGSFGDEPTLTFPGTPAPEGLQVAVLEAGDGPVVEAGSTIVVNYRGQISDGGVFNSSYTRDQTSSFPIRVVMFIRGGDDGRVVTAIRSGERIRMPPRAGYARRGVPRAGSVDQDTFVFVVEIVGVE